MPSARLLTAVAACAITASATAAIDDFTTWDLYEDVSSPTAAQAAAMTGSAAPNLAQLNFTDDVDQDAGFDIGYSSVNANTVGGATSGYYFSAANDFSVSVDFAVTLTNPNGVVAIGLGVGEDRTGVNSAGIGFGMATFGLTGSAFRGAATNNDVATTRDLNAPVFAFVSGSTYSGTLNVAYDAATGDITVGAVGDGSSSTTTFTKAADLTDWAGDDLLVSFFLRSDAVTSPLPIGPWTGQSAEADFLNFTVSQGTATQVPEPTSLALLALGGLAMVRRRRSA